MAVKRSGRGRQERVLRVIAGQWRGRKFRFPPGDIRPTPDRVRETLFNWLQTRIEGATCLDLYAGSGALGLEALSRGAAAVVFVEQQRVPAESLQTLLRDWGAQGAQVVCTEAARYLAQPEGGELSSLGAGRPRFDLVFLDPPYASAELARSAAALQAGWLAPQAHIYLEHARVEPLPALPAEWRELRSGAAGEVRYHLFEAEGAVQPA